MVPLGLTSVLWLLILAVTCYGSNNKVEVVGVVECSDCLENNNAKISPVFSGLHVTIDCKVGGGKYKIKAASKLNEEGKFNISLPNDDIAKNREQKQDCYTNLHSSFGAQCVQKPSKLIFLSRTNGKLTLGLKRNLKFSISACNSAFFWPYFKYPPTWPRIDPPNPSPVYESTIPPPVSQPKTMTPSPAPVELFPPITPIQGTPTFPPIPEFKKPFPPQAPAPAPSLEELFFPAPTPAPIFKMAPL